MGMNSKLNFILGGLFVFVALVVFESHLNAQILPSRAIEIENIPLPPSKLWNLVEKIDEDDYLLRDLLLNVSTKSLDFYENRFTKNGDKIYTSRKKLTEQNKDIGLKIMNMGTGEIRVIKISIRVQRDGIQLFSPSGYQIEIVERPNGIRWNRWNTIYKIVSPQGWLVLKNKYPNINETTQKITVKNKTGKKKTINKKVYSVEEFIYSPYSEELHTSELVEAGSQYLRSIVNSALADLKKNNVPSRTIDGKRVSDISSLLPFFFSYLPILEHTDMTEFIENPQKSVERVLVIIGANKSIAFSKTGSKAGAFGWVQFTPTTYKNIRKAYPAANLISDFETGAADHLNSMKAAILLYDYNLNDFVKKHGNQILSDPRLVEYLAAAYNGRPSRTSLSLKASIAANLNDWINALSSKRGGLADETKGYMVKIRYLQEKGLP